MNRPSKHIHADGFPSLSAFIASDRDNTAAIFKRFRRLAARNLLLLQSELAELEAKLDAFDQQDQESLESLQTLRNWEDYKAKNDHDSERIKLLLDVRAKMNEYREALISESAISLLPPPDRRTLKAFRTNFFHGPPGDGRSFPMLGGYSSSLYDDTEDLVVLHTSEPPDRLTTFVQDYFGYLFTEKAGHGDIVSPLVGYASGKRIAMFISILSIVLAALLLVGAILILHRTESEDLKLGLVALFTIIFAATIGLLTNARKAEVFGATAAYAAVLVVFVSGDIGSAS
ncbi:hypothetical protein B0I35DRAFT_423794 [Stachybotrys elegans]|uniref:DUF6594 domain-containing protein n=1 Tax=Stachybotrys elegans TaxID=80388 RepID=A0A8K0SSZ0_9HYPO|nr:hypothetical protein B0I35DRAFT_423794 [Stachybotrys elegans]